MCPLILNFQLSIFQYWNYRTGILPKGKLNIGMCPETIETVHMGATLTVAIGVVLRHLPQRKRHIGRITAYLPYPL